MAKFCLPMHPCTNACAIFFGVFDVPKKSLYKHDWLKICACVCVCVNDFSSSKNVQAAECGHVLFASGIGAQPSFRLWARQLTEAKVEKVVNGDGGSLKLRSGRLNPPTLHLKENLCNTGEWHLTSECVVPSDKNVLVKTRSRCSMLTLPFSKWDWGAAVLPKLISCFTQLSRIFLTFAEPSTALLSSSPLILPPDGAYATLQFEGTLASHVNACTLASSSTIFSARKSTTVLFEGPRNRENLVPSLSTNSTHRLFANLENQIWKAMTAARVSASKITCFFLSFINFQGKELHFILKEENTCKPTRPVCEYHCVVLFKGTDFKRHTLLQEFWKQLNKEAILPLQLEPATFCKVTKCFEEPLACSPKKAVHLQTAFFHANAVFAC